MSEQQTQQSHNQQTEVQTDWTAQSLQSFSYQPSRENPIRAAVARARALTDDLTASQRVIRDAGRQQVAALRATGLYSLAPHQR